jgi:hypothetical protein
VIGDFKKAFVDSLTDLRIATIGFMMSECPRGTHRLPLDWFSLNFIRKALCENLSRKFSFHYNLTRITGTLHDDQFAFMLLFQLIIMGNITDKSCRENQNTYFHILSTMHGQNHIKHISRQYFFPKILPFEIMWENMVQPDWPQMKIRRMLFLCQITNATNTHSEFFVT